MKMIDFQGSSALRNRRNLLRNFLVPMLRVGTRVLDALRPGGCPLGTREERRGASERALPRRSEGTRDPAAPTGWGDKKHRTANGGYAGPQEIRHFSHPSL